MDAVVKLNSKNITTIFFVLATILVILLLLPKAIAEEVKSVTPKEHAVIKLKGIGISSEMITLLESVHVPDERDRIVELNVLGFLGKADYSGHFSKKAIKKCLEFIRKYKRKLRRVETSYGVPSEVIAALLWVETKHGTHTGKYNVPHVYYSLLQSDHPDVLKATLASLSTREPASAEDIRQKVIDRSFAKSNWALQELTSLDKIRQRKAKELKTLTGSYAGAFGIPQFIPSSYLQWARPKSKSRTPNLFQMDDAIQSVAFYLKSNGWKPASKTAQREALHHYNRADGYVDVILKIADAVSQRKTQAKTATSDPSLRFPLIANKYSE